MRHFAFLVLAIGLLLAVLTPPCTGDSSYDDINAGNNLAGGLNAPPRRFPYLCSVRWFDKSYACSATLVHRRLALTAAHCIVDKRFDLDYKKPPVYCASRHRDRTSKRNKFKSRSRVAPCWSGDSARGCDFAALVLNKNATIPIPQLPLHDEPVPVDVSLTAVALGVSGFRPLVERAEPQMTTSFRKCNAATHEGVQIIYPRISLCAENTEGHDLCRGDSGAPLLIPDPSADSIELGDPSRDTIVGLDSWGSLKCDASRPQIFVKVSAFVDWIQSLIEEIEAEESAAGENQES